MIIMKHTPYTCYRTPSPILIDGDLTKSVWQEAHKSPRFVDMISGAPGFFDTRAAATFWRGTPPRGLRWAFTDWDLSGLHTAVKVLGTLNDNTDIDKGWTAEIAFPWAGMKNLANGRSLPPQDGDEWLIFFGRFGKLAMGNAIIGNAMSWDKIGDNDNHIPERFTRVSFSSQTTPADVT